MTGNEWFYGSEGFGSSTVSQIPVVDPKALCQHRRRLTSYCPACVAEVEREKERQLFIKHVKE